MGTKCGGRKGVLPAAVGALPQYACIPSVPTRLYRAALLSKHQNQNVERKAELLSQVISLIALLAKDETECAGFILDWSSELAMFVYLMRRQRGNCGNKKRVFDQVIT